MGFTEVAVIITLCISQSLCTGDSQGNDKWGRPPAIYSPQHNYQSILLGIEQRLRSLDTIRHTTSRNEILAQDLINRFELIETRITGFQNTMQHKFEAITTAVSSSEMKLELLMDQMTRKLQTELDRMNHKLSNAESRIETTVTNIQNKIEMNFQKVDTKQINNANELSKVNSGVETLKSQSVAMETRYNHTLNLIVNHVQELRHEHADKKEHLKNLTSLVTSLHSKRSEQCTQSDAPFVPTQHMQIIKTEISSESQRIGSKMSNMYNDMWRNIKDLETIFKVSMNENNNNSRELYNELREKLIEEKKDSDSFIDVVMQGVMSNVQSEFSQLSREIQRMKISLESNTDSCQKLKIVIENRVAIILTKMFETITSRSEKSSKQIEDLEILIKGDNKQLFGTASKLMHKISILNQDTTMDHKQMDSIITEVSEKTDELTQSLEDVQMETQEIKEAFLKQLNSLKELKRILINNFENKDNKTMNGSLIESIGILEANYSNGVIKILTDHTNKQEEPTQDKDERTTKGKRKISLSKLNESLNTSDLVAVIGESKNNFETSTTSIPLISEEKVREGDEEDDFEDQEESSEDYSKSIDVAQILLCYIKYIRGHLSPHEFLVEAIPGAKFENLRDMARQLNRIRNIPKDVIENIEEMAKESDKSDKDQLMDKQMNYVLRQMKKEESLNEDENYDEDFNEPVY